MRVPNNAVILFIYPRPSTAETMLFSLACRLSSCGKDINNI